MHDTHLVELQNTAATPTARSTIAAMLDRAHKRHIREMVTTANRLTTPHGLTSKEFRCLMLAAKGTSEHETAVRMGVKIWTVKKYRAGIFRKWHVKNMHQAVVHAMREGIL